MSALSHDVEALLAGLEVRSLEELERLVRYGRGLVVTPNQREAIEAMFPDKTVLVRGAERRGYFEGAVHVQRTDDKDWLGAVVLAADCSKDGGCLGISYRTLMTIPSGKE
jgi:hypothetical protein